MALAKNQLSARNLVLPASSDKVPTDQFAVGTVRMSKNLEGTGDSLEGAADHKVVIFPKRATTAAQAQRKPDRVTIVTSNAAVAEGKTTRAEFVSFDRSELDMMLGVYGRRVAKGEWRDYAIDLLRDRAVFSIFRHSAEMPIYRIEKNPKLARRQGAYSVISAAGTVLKRGQDLRQVLRVFERKNKVVSL